MKPPSAHDHQCCLTMVAGMLLSCSPCPTMACCFPNKFHCSVYHFCHRESLGESVILLHGPISLTKYCRLLFLVQPTVSSRFQSSLPLSLVQDLAKLSLMALITDAFILVGLLYIFASEIWLSTCFKSVMTSPHTKADRFSH